MVYSASKCESEQRYSTGFKSAVSYFCCLHGYGSPIPRTQRRKGYRLEAWVCLFLAKRWSFWLQSLLLLLNLLSRNTHPGMEMYSSLISLGSPLSYLQMQRRTISSCKTRESFSKAASRSAPTHGSLANTLLHKLTSIVLTRLPSWQDQFVHVQHEATHLVLCLVLERLMGQSPEGPELELIQSLYADSKNLLAFPFNVPGSGYSKHAEGHKRLIDILKEKIDQRRTSELPKCEDFLDALLVEEKRGAFTAKSGVILDCILGVLLHAEETTAMAMTLLIKFLSESPQALNQVKEEHIAVQKRKGQAEKLNCDDYQSLKFTTGVINESLRLANVVPWVSRVTMQDVEIKGFLVPKGWKVLLFLMGSHVSATYQDDPKSFNPWRWQDSANNPTFTPYGAGLRCCPGAEVSKMMLAIFVHYLVTRYSWQVVGDDDVICFPVMNFQEGFPIVVKSLMDADECLILH
ncbi:hypothetical protein GOP47_0016798 [Adiantum capillus-veneris]|uniref:Cytochrome P450 n=1 Tax=Adiantum capillus-veneris TaxID=13818 RepID=A0A9D4ZAN1_ADICA|nr:hypothetical protein GOP47_0016798 [Adiantum capillus-veneris]